MAFGVEDRQGTPAYRDLDPSDFRHLTDYLPLHGAFHRTVLYPPHEVSVIQGVRIECVDDQHLYKQPDFGAVEFSLKDCISIFVQGEPSGPFLSKPLDFPRNFSQASSNLAGQHVKWPITRPTSKLTSNSPPAF